MGKVSVGKKKLSSGNQSLFLDYYFQGRRHKEYLKIVLYKGDRDQNRERLNLAYRIAAKRELEIHSENFGFITPLKKNLDFNKWLSSFADEYVHKDKRVVTAMSKAFDAFTKRPVKVSTVTELLCEDFNAWLHEHYNGETPFNYFDKFKRACRVAVKQGLFAVSPSSSIKNTNTRKNELNKEVLFSDEIQLLVNTEAGNAEVKRAFLFSTQTGLRLVDILNLKWKQVHIHQRHIKFTQSKTDKVNFVPLNENAIFILGLQGKPDEKVFNISTSHNAVNKVLQAWVKRAGINKHITYHCARHSAATNLILSGNELKIASMTMGHSSVEMTEKYTHITDAIKQKAVEKLPKINFGKG